MPTNAAARREEEIITAVARAWASATDLAVSIAGWPDRDRQSGTYPPGLTVDALLRASNGASEAVWAVDVVTLTWHPRLVPAVEWLVERLQAALEAVASRNQRRIVVGVGPRIGDPDGGASYVAAIVQWVEELIQGTDPKRSPFANDPNTYIDVRDEPFTDAGSPVKLMYLLSSTTSTFDQLQESLADPLRRKLDGQLLKAHDLGYPTMLVIDQVGHEDLPHGTNFLPSVGTVSQFVTSRVAQHGHATGGHVLDFGALVCSDGCVPIYGGWPAVGPA
jgi:hypothetical protein